PGEKDRLPEPRLGLIGLDSGLTEEIEEPAVRRVPVLHRVRPDGLHQGSASKGHRRTRMSPEAASSRASPSPTMTTRAEQARGEPRVMELSVTICTFGSIPFSRSYWWAR